MIIRPIYLKTLRKYRDIPLVKILAGIRRCGKSTILEMLKNDLMESGVSESNIISVRYTAETLNRSMTAQEMFDEIKSQMSGQGKYYLLNYRLGKSGQQPARKHRCRHLCDRLQLETNVRRDIHLPDRAVHLNPGLYAVFR